MKPIHTVAELDDALSTPTSGVLDVLRRVPGDIIVLGAGGKMGPTLAMMVRRGLDAIGESSRRVFAVSRFSSPAAAETLRQARVETIACDLMNREAVGHLPDAPNVISLVGQKFGTREAPELTWVTNTLVPALVAERFAKSRIVALSTGCVYPLVAADGPGSGEDDPLGPPGEYANSCVGRERVFEHYSKANETPMVFVRLCYAIDLRYGVLLDLAQQVYQRQAIDVGMGATHAIWQGDANARVIQSLARAAVPPVAVNVTGRDRLSIRALAIRLGELLGREVCFTGHEAPTAWLWDARRSYDWFGPPTVSIDELLEATAHWVLCGGKTLNRPTHFQVRDGQF
ncbi:MAG: NAD-dependent epimerase/dehydratase family protein [Planctomycetaceae bacterium]|nr:NAD-dependent epimerase/dehydratase family protein [Planctomycetaceae bacterium]